MRAALASLLVSLPALAEVPGGHVYFGLGGSWMVPLASSDMRGFRGPLHQAVALSVELAYETQHALVAVGIEYGGLTAFQPEFGLVSLRAGWILGEGPTAPYLSAGMGLLRESVQLRYDCVGGGCAVASAEDARLHRRRATAAR
ncbi:MAG: hypothetical protein E6J78_12635 [Deltaproteobacteria bacterium]|nr:MAG: hypothetical protein E6J78_12635 [Deltaproteobacteria bacterium]